MFKNNEKSEIGICKRKIVGLRPTIARVNPDTTMPFSHYLFPKTFPYQDH
jgi:hypothetical protein